LAVPGQRIEQRPRLRAEEPPAGATVVVRGGRDSPEKLRSHVQRTARAWSLDGQPLLGISVFAVLGEPLDDLLRRRFAAFRTIYLPPSAAWLITDSTCCLPGGARISPCGCGVRRIRNSGNCWRPSALCSAIPRTLGESLSEGRTEDVPGGYHR
jgi:hypothetical protein